MVKKTENIEQCYKKSIELLINNSTSFGFLAASKSKNAITRDYLSVFSRDISICSLGALASKNSKLQKTTRKSLETLAKHQASNGQIPNYVKIKNNYANFWYLGCIDATLWWLITLKFYGQHADDGRKLLKTLDAKIKKAIQWLNCQKHPEDGLIMQNEASDWADIMPRSGRVLYSNTLWHKINLLYKTKNYENSKKNFNANFYPFDDKVKSKNICQTVTRQTILNNKKPTNYYLSFINYLFWGNDVDVYGNCLAVLFELPNKNLQKKIINHLLNHKPNKNLPIPTLLNPIKTNSKLWREYMESYKQNFPYQYHNGGIWPYVSCFWAMTLAKAGKNKEAWQELEKIATINKVNNWQFNEWFHAKTGKPMGMPKQSWNAGAFLLAYHYLQQDIKF